MADDGGVDVEVEVGGWEHECCGDAIERGQLVDLDCQRTMGEDGLMHLHAGRHSPAERRVRGRVRGRVRHIQVLRPGQPSQPVLRVPSGRAVRGFDPEDDGHLENPWTGEAVPDGENFIITVRPSR